MLATYSVCEQFHDKSIINIVIININISGMKFSSPFYMVKVKSTLVNSNSSGTLGMFKLWKI